MGMGVWGLGLNTMFQKRYVEDPNSVSVGL